MNEEDAECLGLENLKVRDYIQVVEGIYFSMYTTIVLEIEVNKFSMQYFSKKQEWWTLIT